ncbi:hypothetical protein DFH09DRAFT_1333861 [Mycena vulgaris]|nr:hypothetical protein DFH09DRAFT_1333861 [Mycena vulgaris]
MSEPTATSPSSPQPTILLVDPVTVIGPIFLGNSFNWMLMGFLLMQIYTYWRNFPKDKTTVKLLVYTVCVLDLLQTAFGTHEAWWFSIQNWGNVSALQGDAWTSVMSPILCGVISAMVQIFYALRIWTLKRNAIPRLLAILIILLALGQSLAAIVASSVVGINSGICISSKPHRVPLDSSRSLSIRSKLLRLHPVFSFWLAGSFATDILVAGGMIWILYTAHPTLPQYNSNIESILNRLMLNTIQTGMVTVLCAGIALALFVGFTNRNYYWAFTYILGKLYSNSFMVTLNSRASRRRWDGSESVSVGLQRSRQTDRTEDSVIFASPNTKDCNSTTEFNTEDIPGQKHAPYASTPGHTSSTYCRGTPGAV